MRYQSYKGRFIDFSAPVSIYKNLHNGLFSIKQRGLVVAHVESFIMQNVTFKVSEAGRQQVIKTKQKAIHAFIVGMLEQVNCTDDDIIISNPHTMIRYNPYIFDSFIIGVNNAPIKQAAIVYGCCKNGICSI